jgi:hypothetical protein
MKTFIEYEILPCANVPAGLARQRLAVLSTIWQGQSLRLEYPDGTVHLLRGCSGPEPGRPCDLRIFWTRHQPQGPAVCLALGGDYGLLVLDSEEPDAGVQGYPFLALAEGLIPPEVLEVIGPPPQPEPREIRLLA